MHTNSFKMILALACTLGLMVGCSSTPEEEPMEEVVETPAPEPTPVEPVEEMPDLETVFYFDFDSSTLTPESRAALTAQAEYLQGNSDSIRLEGHADERGTREYNMALGERRANAVADFMVLQGVSRSRIETISYGEERPARVGSDESAWAMNRRVELK